MKTRLTSVLVTMAALIPAAMSAETLDRIAVTVGGHVMSESEVIQYIRSAAFLDGKAPDLSGPNKRAAAAKLVDQYLVLEDAALTRAALPSAADVDPLVESVRARYATNAEYQNALKQAGITEAGLKAHFVAGLRMLRYTDVRFRPEVQISDEELRTLYNSLPEQERAVRSLEQSRRELEQVIAGERVMRALDQWLEMTRHDIAITYREAVFR
jgi:hypothetical protein